MNEETFTLERGSFHSSDGISRIDTRLWLPAGEPQCIVQLVHGMCEHIDRYAPYAEYLAEKGIAVIGHNHLGHGANTSCKGFFASKDGLSLLVGDVYRVNRIIAKRFPNKPIVLLGHSMGSFVTRKYITMYPSTIDGYVCMGTGNNDKRADAGIALIKVLRKLHGDKYRSPLIESMTLGAYGKSVPGTPHRHAWISKNERNWYTYEDDPLCGFTFTLAGYQDVVEMSKETNSDAWFESVPKTLPIFLISGADDPVGDMGKGVSEVYSRLMSAGCNAEILLIPNQRHEVLNESNPYIAYEAINSFLRKNRLIDYGNAPVNEPGPETAEASEDEQPARPVAPKPEKLTELPMIYDDPVMPSDSPRETVFPDIIEKPLFGTDEQTDDDMEVQQIRLEEIDLTGDSDSTK